MKKFWWKGEPLIVGSLRWAVIDNDLKNNIRDTLKQLKNTIQTDTRIIYDPTPDQELQKAIEYWSVCGWNDPERAKHAAVLLDAAKQLKKERDELKVCAEALKSSKTQLQNILDYHALQFVSDESKLVAEIKEIDKALSQPITKSLLNKEK